MKGKFNAVNMTNLWLLFKSSGDTFCGWQTLDSRQRDPALPQESVAKGCNSYESKLLCCWSSLT